MNTTIPQAFAEAPHRLTPSSPTCAPSMHPRIFLGLCAALGALVCLSARSAEPTYKLFGRQLGGYSSKDDLDAFVKKELGPRASVAEWDEVKTRYGKSETDLKTFCDQIGLKLNRSAWVIQGGKPFWQEERRYFIYRADHNLPSDFMLHDQLQNNFLLLGSWYETRPVLVKILDFNAIDAAKWAKWDKMADEAEAKDIAGVYKLAAVNGKTVPALITHEGVELQVLSGVFTINSNGTCGTHTTFIPLGQKEISIDRRATYTSDGAKLAMQWIGAGTTSGKVEGSTFTMNNEGMVFVYKK